jgi:hypothetical protein
VIRFLTLNLMTQPKITSTQRLGLQPHELRTGATRPNSQARPRQQNQILSAANEIAGSSYSNAQNGIEKRTSAAKVKRSPKLRERGRRGELQLQEIVNERPAASALLVAWESGRKNPKQHERQHQRMSRSRTWRRPERLRQASDLRFGSHSGEPEPASKSGQPRSGASEDRMRDQWLRNQDEKKNKI